MCYYYNINIKCYILVLLVSKEYIQGCLKEFFIGLEIKNNRKNEKEVIMLIVFLFYKFRN